MEQTIQRAEADRSEWTWFVKAVALCYKRPDSVVRRMTRYCLSRGKGALLAKLAENPSYFGRQLVFRNHGGDLLRISLRREAHRASALLTVLAQAAFDTERYPVNPPLRSKRSAQA